MRRRVEILVGVLTCSAASALGACDGHLSTSGDAGAVVLMIDGASPIDGGDPSMPDAFVSTTPDAYIPPLGDCTMGTPLETPIAGCMPTPMPSTGDPAEDCVRRINQFRCECQHLPPLQRWRDGEACADQMAQYDSEGRGAHAGFRDRICSGGNAQNECPGWGSEEQVVSGCLQQMWDEGPGDFYGPPPHGHYINMSSTTYSMVACGFASTPSGVWAVQNFR